MYSCASEVRGRLTFALLLEGKYVCSFPLVKSRENTVIVILYIYIDIGRQGDRQTEVRQCILRSNKEQRIWCCRLNVLHVQLRALITRETSTPHSQYVVNQYVISLYIRTHCIFNYFNIESFFHCNNIIVMSQKIQRKKCQRGPAKICVVFFFLPEAT